MYEEIKYRNIAYILAITLICWQLFGIGTWGDLFDILFGVLTITTTLFCYLWLRKIVVFIGLILYFLSFNFELLFNQTYGITNWNNTSIEFYNTLEIVAFSLVVAGLLDKYFGDKYLNQTSNLRLKPTIIILITGTLVIQTMTRFYA